MTQGAPTPEDVDTFLEDVFVLRDPTMVDAVFDDDAVLVEAGGLGARGGEAIARAVAALWAGDAMYVAHAHRVLQAGDTALVVADAGLHVLRRGDDRTWRAAISLLALHTSSEGEDHMTHETQLLAPAVTRGKEGEARWWLNCLAEIKVTAEQTGGLLSILEITEPPNSAEPLHVHHREDEGFWILEGDVTFEVADTTIEATAGDFVFGPRGVPHRYTVGAGGCRMLYIMTPGGFENMVREMSVPADSRTVPPPSSDEPDWDHVAAVAKAHACELLG
jgi:mannose-6-phosphate isomerase-like protein (cupin superfamily)/ketosteroid isomerase-like protein